MWSSICKHPRIAWLFFSPMSPYCELIFSLLSITPRSFSDFLIHLSSLQDTGLCDSLHCDQSLFYVPLSLKTKRWQPIILSDSPTPNSTFINVCPYIVMHGTLLFFIAFVAQGHDQTRCSSANANNWRKPVFLVTTDFSFWGFSQLFENSNCSLSEKCVRQQMEEKFKYHSNTLYA